MCIETRLCSSSGNNPSREAFLRSKQKSNQGGNGGGTAGGGLPLEEPAEPVHIIPKQNKGLCTACDVAVWIIKETNVEIKWCKGCKNFRPWAAFGDKGLATKCLRCRERQREKYATQKEEKYKRSGEKKAKVDTQKASKSVSPKKTKAKSRTGSGTKFSSPENHGMSCLIAATTQVTSEK